MKWGRREERGRSCLGARERDEWWSYAPKPNMAKAVQIAATHTPMDTSAIAIKNVNLRSRGHSAGFLNSGTSARPREKLAPSDRSLLSTVASLPVQFFA